MEDKIGEIVTLLPFGIKTRVVEVQSDSCEGCYYNYLCENYISNGALGFCTCNIRKTTRT